MLPEAALGSERNVSFDTVVEASAALDHGVDVSIAPDDDQIGVLAQAIARALYMTTMAW